jgi:hypothetical protein
MDLTVIEKITLKSGSHDAQSGEMCVMEAVAFIAGEPWSDSPQCVCPVIAAALRSWNDSLQTDADRDRLLKPLIPLLIGTRGTKADECRRSYMAVDWLIRVYTPKWLRLIPSLTEIAEKLEAWREIKGDDDLPTDLIQQARFKAAAAWAAARAAAGDADAAWGSAWDAARAATRAAARAAARDAARDAARAAAWAAAGDVLKKPTEELQVSATELFRRMCRPVSAAQPEGSK